MQLLNMSRFVAYTTFCSGFYLHNHIRSEGRLIPFVAAIIPVSPVTRARKIVLVASDDLATSARIRIFVTFSGIAFPSLGEYHLGSSGLFIPGGW
jgi:hypothetical protein